VNRGDQRRLRPGLVGLWSDDCLRMALVVGTLVAGQNFIASRGLGGLGADSRSEP